jgi:hypothetical protein
MGIEGTVHFLHELIKWIYEARKATITHITQ